MGGRFPGSRNVTEFWQNLCNGVESITQFTRGDLEQTGTDPLAFEDPSFVPAGSILEDIDLFDANFFGFSPREAESLDPQHRLFLEAAWTSLEDAGYDPETYPGLIGVYGGCALSSYFSYLETLPEFMALLGYLQVYIGNDKDYLTTRVSYSLNLKGPSFSVQTACSTSLLAATIAADQLRNGQCDMAIAGGVCVRVPQVSGYYHEPGGIYSPDGHCRVFDEKAEGVVFGNGVGAVVLKRLSDAIADRDSIYAVMRGWAVNNDGTGKSSYAAPSVAGQADVIRSAHRMSNIDVNTIGYVEAHGTGTVAGDPVEIEALTDAFRTSTDRSGFCAVGSVKSNVGHLDPAAGVAALIKTTLALHHEVIPPSLNCETPNPAIDFERSPFFVNRELTPWPRNATPRRAGVSAFGIGGTNVHVVLEEAPQNTFAQELPGNHLLLLSGRSPATLEASWTTMQEQVGGLAVRPGDVAYTTQVGRRHWKHRAALLYKDVDEIVTAGTGASSSTLLRGNGPARERSVAFMFSGQGSQYVNMARGLYDHEPAFRDALDRCLKLLAPELPSDLRRLLYPSAKRAAHAGEALLQTQFTQPSLFAVEFALARLWMEWGVEPTAMIGHSVGEYVAACIAGVFSLEDAVSLVAERGRLMQRLPSGSMLAVFAPEADLREIVGDTLDVAAINEPGSCVLSGATDVVDALERRLEVEGIACRRLRTSHAFHSRMMDPMLASFRDRLAQVHLNAPRIPYVANVTGTWVTPSEATDPEFWCRHVREPVRFMEGLGALLEPDDRVLVEVGPGQTLTSLARHHPARRADQLVVQSLRHSDDRRQDDPVLLEAIARIWLAGGTINWSKLHAGQERCRVHLPTYPYERRRYWPHAEEEREDEAPGLLKEPDIQDWFYAARWSFEPAVITETPEPCQWLCFADQCGVGAHLAEVLTSDGHEVVEVRTGRRFARLSTDEYEINPSSKADYDSLIDSLAQSGLLPRRVLHLWGLTSVDPGVTHTGDGWEDFESTEAELDRGYFSVLQLSQALVATRAADPIDILVATSNAQLVPGDDDLVPARAMVQAACKAVTQEYPHLAFQHVDVDCLAHNSDEVRQTAFHVLGEAGHVGESPSVAIRKNQRWVQVYEPLDLEDPLEPQVPWREDGVYLITGGLGAIGLALARHLALEANAKVALLGHTPIPSRQEWDAWLDAHEPGDRTSVRISRLLDIEVQGGDVLVMAADVADQKAMSVAIDHIGERFGRLDGVIHAAGNLGPDGFFGIDEANREACKRQFHAKVSGSLALAKALGDAELDFVILMSSISSVLAGLGYVAYAAANTYLDAFASKMSARSSTPWISVEFDTWEDDADLGEVDPYHLAMNDDEGIEVLRIVGANATQPVITVSTGDLQARIDQWVNVASLRQVKVRTDDDLDHRHPRPDLTKPYVAPETDIEIEVAKTMQELLGIADIGTADDFFADLGGTSLLATQLVARLRQRYPVELSLRRFFEGPTVTELAQVIASDDGAHAR
jgi:acyl transferase domain-containing protein/acyl carrier protein